MKTLRTIQVLTCLLNALLIENSLQASELTAAETRHWASCPDPADAPCVMKRPFHAMDYTLLSKQVTIAEGNGVWIVKLAPELVKAGKNQSIRVMDFYGNLHVIDVLVLAPSSNRTPAKSTQSGTHASAKTPSLPMPVQSTGEKPISLEKFIPK